MKTLESIIQPRPPMRAEERPPASTPAQELARRYREVRAFSEELCAPLETEDYVIQSMPDASPVKWHLAHTTWFFETFLLKKVRPNRPERHSQYAYLFNSYYNAVGPMHSRPRRGMISRPTVRETLAYRHEIDAELLEWLDGKESLPGDLNQIIELGLNHEQQHQELLVTDLKHLLAQNPLRPVYLPRLAGNADHDGSVPMDWAPFAEQIAEVGHEGNGFHFDNETPRHRELIPAFAMGTRLITNAEYLAFMEDGGYERAELWLSLGWSTRGEQEWEAPLYWEREGKDWQHFTLAGMQPIAPHEPVCHISYFEADAFARWSQAQLPSEAQWERAARDIPMKGNFAEGRQFHPQPSQGGDGLQQMFGDVWEWTRSSYAPYPGYQPLPGALGEYNGKFMCNQYILRGGSCATAASHIRKTYRNFFGPDKRWQFTGLRLIKELV